MNSESVPAFATPAAPARRSVEGTGARTQAAQASGGEAGQTFLALLGAQSGSTVTAADGQALMATASTGDAAVVAPSIARDPLDATVQEQTSDDPTAWLNLMANGHGMYEGRPYASAGTGASPAPGSAERRTDALADKGARQTVELGDALNAVADADALSDLRHAAGAARATDPHHAGQPESALRGAPSTALLQAHGVASMSERKEAGTVQNPVAWAVANATAAANASSFDMAAVEHGASAIKRGSVREPHPRSSTSPGVPGFSPWPDSTTAGTQHGANPVYAPGALTPAPETAMAQRVHYWVTRGVQSAELQLDAFEGGSVDVSIAVKGDQAFVEFRTDQPEARRLLLDAMPQLKSLLANEGLMLSGGFVGGSGDNSGGQQARENTRQGGRDSMVRTDMAPVVQQSHAARAGAAVDLFV